VRARHRVDDPVGLDRAVEHADCQPTNSPVGWNQRVKRLNTIAGKVCRIQTPRLEAPRALD